jgi:hypothetical protein
VKGVSHIDLEDFAKIKRFDSTLFREKNTVRAHFSLLSSIVEVRAIIIE